MEDSWHRVKMRSPSRNGLTASRADRDAPTAGLRPEDSGLGKWAGCGRPVARGLRLWARSDQKPRSPLAVARGRKPRKGGYQNQPRDCETGGPNPSKRTSPFSDIRTVLRRGRIAAEEANAQPKSTNGSAEALWYCARMGASN